jgi:hypothetical protein
MEQRKKEIKGAIDKLAISVMKRQARIVVGANGSVTIVGWQANDRAGITDACAYRRLLVQGNALVQAELKRAEQIAGRTVDKRMLAQGIHSHDGGNTWSTHKG